MYFQVRRLIAHEYKDRFPRDDPAGKFKALDQMVADSDFVCDTEQLAQSGNALKLCGVNETVREVLDLTDLTSLFEYFEDINAAVRSYL